VSVKAALSRRAGLDPFVMEHGALHWAGNELGDDLDEDDDEPAVWMS